MTVLNRDYENWIKASLGYFRGVWGLSDAFALKAARLFLMLYLYGLSPKITSGFRSPEKQEELKRRYEMGDKSIRYKPAGNSKHSSTGFIGQPAANAIDISTNNAAKAAQVAKMIGVKPGYDFGDPVHFYI